MMDHNAGTISRRLLPVAFFDRRTTLVGRYSPENIDYMLAVVCDLLAQPSLAAYNVPYADFSLTIYIRHIFHHEMGRG